MSINANNTALNEILSMINNLPGADGSGGGTVYTNIVYNDDNTVTLTDKDGVDHIMVCEYTDGVLSGLNYDGKSVELTYEEDTLVNIGAIEVDMANVPIESGGGDDDFIGIKYSDFTGAYGNPKIADARSLDEIITSSNDTIVFNSLFKSPNPNANGGFQSSLEDVYLPSKVSRTLNYTFMNCANLTTIHGNFEEVEYLGSTFESCKKLTNIPYMPNLIYIGNGAFRDCRALTEVRIYSNKLTEIATTAFQYCSAIKDIYVPWAEGAVGGAPWGATNENLQIHYNTTYDENHNPIV